MRLNPAGEMVRATWLELPHRFRHVRLDAFIVMPDHFHGLILLDSGDAALGPLRKASPAGPPSGSLGQIIQAFKSETTHRYVLGVRHAGWPEFRGRLWQRNFHDQILRRPEHLEAARRYIDLNPTRWRRG
jgi:REP element-mobilizing transposase RayT